MGLRGQCICSNRTIEKDLGIYEIQLLVLIIIIPPHLNLNELASHSNETLCQMTHMTCFKIET